MYRCVLEVTGPITLHDSIADAYLVHRERAVPPALLGSRDPPALITGRQVQRFYEQSFYEGRSLVGEPVVAIPLRAVEWMD